MWGKRSKTRSRVETEREHPSPQSPVRIFHTLCAAPAGLWRKKDERKGVSDPSATHTAPVAPASPVLGAKFHPKHLGIPSKVAGNSIQSTVPGRTCLRAPGTHLILCTARALLPPPPPRSPGPGGCLYTSPSLTF